MGHGDHTVWMVLCYTRWGCILTGHGDHTLWMVVCYTRWGCVQTGHGDHTVDSTVLYRVGLCIDGTWWSDTVDGTMLYSVGCVQTGHGDHTLWMLVSLSFNSSLLHKLTNVWQDWPGWLSVCVSCLTASLWFSSWPAGSDDSLSCRLRVWRVRANLKSANFKFSVVSCHVPEVISPWNTNYIIYGKDNYSYSGTTSAVKNDLLLTFHAAVFHLLSLHRSILFFVNTKMVISKPILTFLCGLTPLTVVWSVIML